MPHPAPHQDISTSATAQAASQPVLPSNEEPLIFLFFLVSRGGEDLQGAAGKAALAMPMGTGLAPSLS